MRLYEFANQVDFKIKKFGDFGFRIYVLSDVEIDKNSIPPSYRKVFKYPNQVGFIDVGEPKFGYLKIENVFLVPEVRRQGLGKILYNKALEIAKKEFAAKGLYSDPSERNEISDKFWRSKSQGSGPGGINLRRDPF